MRRLFVYIILTTWLLANIDWKPIHSAWWHHGEWPEWASGSWENWNRIRFTTALILCPPCGALAENYYYVLMEIEAGEEEQDGVMPMGWTHNPINPHGDWMFRWGQGEGRPWRKVSMLAFYLYWLPYTIIWWYGWKGVFWILKQTQPLSGCVRVAARFKRPERSRPIGRVEPSQEL